MTGSFDETVALLERCYALTTVERPGTTAEIKRNKINAAAQERIDEICARVIEEEVA